MTYTENQPAFPQMVNSGLGQMIGDIIHLDKELKGGATLLQYFMAHAPYPVPEWYINTLQTGDVKEMHPYVLEAAYMQWPRYWSEQMIERSGE